MWIFNTHLDPFYHGFDSSKKEFIYIVLLAEILHCGVVIQPIKKYLGGPVYTEWIKYEMP